MPHEEAEVGGGGGGEGRGRWGEGGMVVRREVWALGIGLDGGRKWEEGET